MNSREKSPHLFSHWDEIAGRLRQSSGVLLGLDFDGTLVRIAPRPDQVRVAARTARILRRLVRHPKVSVMLVSGRTRADLRRHINLSRVRCLGLYGWDCNEHFSLSQAEETDLMRARLKVGRELKKFTGAWMEAKDYSLSVHVRSVTAKSIPRLRRAVRGLVHPLRKSLHVFENARDIEIAPRSVKDKGAAVRGFLAEPEHRNDLAFFIGDDFSDEPAFRAVHKGISVLVGRARPSSARFRLRGPAEVATALARIEEAIR